MTRWKILKQSIKFLLTIAFLWSCSEEKSDLGQDIFLEISERKEFKIGDSGLVPELFNSVSLNESKTKGLIFNEVVHSLDSIFLSTDSAWVTEGEFLEMEGPYGVGTVFSFFNHGNHRIFMNSQEFFR
jgi:hypothetical protein